MNLLHFPSIIIISRFSYDLIARSTQTTQLEFLENKKFESVCGLTLSWFGQPDRPEKIGLQSNLTL